MKTHKLLCDETVLSDDYPIIFGYVYIMDNIFTRNDWAMDDVTVGQYKKKFGIKEVRRCALFSHPTARLGDRVE